MTPRLLPFFRSEAQLRILGLLLLGVDRSWTAEQVQQAVGNGFLRKIVEGPVEPLVGDLAAQR
jgi:hypothetical protein